MVSASSDASRRLVEDGIEAARVVEHARTADELDPAHLPTHPDDAVRAPRGQEADALVAETSISSRPCTEFAAGISAADSRLTTVTSSGAAPDAPRGRRRGRRARPSPRRAHLLFGRHRDPRQHGTHRGARRVERHETTADHDDALPDRNAVAAIDVEQVVDRLDHAIEIAALDGEDRAPRPAPMPRKTASKPCGANSRTPNVGVSGRLKRISTPSSLDLRRPDGR